MSPRKRLFALVVACLAATYAVEGLSRAQARNPLVGTWSASCVMLLPIDACPLSTYHHGYWKISDMMKPGLVMSIAWLILLTGTMWLATQLGMF